MRQLYLRSIGYLVLIITSIYLLTSIGLAQEIRYSGFANKNKKLGVLQEEARLYRQEGLKFQRLGRLDETMSCYQKAIALDPYYVEPYNDLGIVYEMKGWQDEAIELYKTALEIDPNYLAAYSNLAIIYEERGDLKIAAEYWKRRADLGSPDDYWTQKAGRHLEYIGMIIEDVARGLKEEEIINLIEDMKKNRPLVDLTLQEKDEKKQKAISFLNSAEVKLQRGEYSQALKDAGFAKHLDPSNTQIDKFIEQVHSKLRETYGR